MGRSHVAKAVGDARDTGDAHVHVRLETLSTPSPGYFRFYRLQVWVNHHVYHDTTMRVPALE
jgi:hypothetical protein